MFAGRKKECSVWMWFNYDDVQAKSICQAMIKDGKECGKKLAGKNPTNLKVFRCSSETDVIEPPLKKWKCLAAKQRTAAGASVPPTVGLSTPQTAQNELNKYTIEVRNSTPFSDALTFCRERRKV